MPKILITGANGLLGQHLIQQLLKEENWEIVATAKNGNRLHDKKGYVFYPLDICKKDAIDEIWEKEKPDFLIHAAALTHVDVCEKEKSKCWQTNVTATHYLIEAARRHHTFFTFISTDFIFDGAGGPYKEGDIPNPVNFYGLSKLAAEMLLKGSSIPYSILRTVLVYGVPEDAARSNIVLWIKKSLEERKNIRVVDDQWRTPTLVQDLAMGCKLVIEKKLSDKDVSSIYNISGREIMTPYQMAMKTAAFFHLDESLITRADATTFSQVAKRPAKTGFFIDKAGEELGYIPHSFEEGLQLIQKRLKNLKEKQTHKKSMNTISFGTE